MAAQPKVTLYTRAGCCLCDRVKETLDRAVGLAAFELEVLDIDGDPRLRALYNHEVPVVAINGRKAFKYHLDMREFLKKLAARS